MDIYNAQITYVNEKNPGVNKKSIHLEPLTYKEFNRICNWTNKKPEMFGLHHTVDPAYARITSPLRFNNFMELFNVALETLGVKEIGYKKLRYRKNGRAKKKSDWIFLKTPEVEFQVPTHARKANDGSPKVSVSYWDGSWVKFTRENGGVWSTEISIPGSELFHYKADPDAFRHPDGTLPERVVGTIIPKYVPLQDKRIVEHPAKEEMPKKNEPQSSLLVQRVEQNKMHPRMLNARLAQPKASLLVQRVSMLQKERKTVQKRFL